MKNLIIITFIFICSMGVIAQDINAGLVAYYPFNGDVTDASGNGNTGQVINATLTEGVNGVANSAYLFNGLDTYITIPSSESLNRPDTAITMSAWIYLNGLSLIGSSFGPVLMKSDLAANNFSYRLSLSLSNIAAATNNWGNGTFADTVLALNTWYHFVASLSEDKAKFYLNGVLIKVDTNYTTDLFSDNLPLEIGRDVPGDLEIFNGKIDEVRVYDRAISDEEVSELYFDVVTGVSEISTKEISIFPVPTKNKLTISSNDRSQFQMIEIYNVSGIKVENLKFEPTHQKTIDISNLVLGVYHLQIVGDNWSAIRNIVKE